MSNVMRHRLSRVSAVFSLSVFMFLMTGCGGAPVQHKPEPPAAATQAAAVATTMTMPSAATIPTPAPAPAKAPMATRHVHRRHHRPLANRKVTLPIVPSSATAVAPVKPQAETAPVTTSSATPPSIQATPRACAGSYFSCSSAVYWAMGGIVAVIIALLLVVGIVSKSKGKT